LPRVTDQMPRAGRRTAPRGATKAQAAPRLAVGWPPRAKRLLRTWPRPTKKSAGVRTTECLAHVFPSNIYGCQGPGGVCADRAAGAWGDGSAGAGRAGGGEEWAGGPVAAARRWFNDDLPDAPTQCPAAGACQTLASSARTILLSRKTGASPNCARRPGPRARRLARKAARGHCPCQRLPGASGGITACSAPGASG
jgi:hypothetical protein